jgi:hypothetical protein
VPIRGSVRRMTEDVDIFRSTLVWRLPACGSANGTFPRTPFLPEIPSERRPKKPVFSAVPKPCATSCTASVCTLSRTRAGLPLPRCVSGSIALPAKGHRGSSIARAPGDHPKSRASWHRTAIASSIQTPCSMVPALPSGAATNSPRCWPTRLGSSSVGKVCAVC